MRTLHSSAPQPTTHAILAVLRLCAAQPDTVVQLYHALRGDPPFEATLLAMHAHAALGNWQAAVGMLSHAEGHPDRFANEGLPTAVGELAAALARSAVAAARDGNSGALDAAARAAHEALTIARCSPGALLSAAAVYAAATVAAAASDGTTALLALEAALRWGLPLELHTQCLLLEVLSQQGQLTGCALPTSAQLPSFGPKHVYSLASVTCSGFDRVGAGCG